AVLAEPADTGVAGGADRGNGEGEGPRGCPTARSAGDGAAGDGAEVFGASGDDERVGIVDEVGEFGVDGRFARTGGEGGGVGGLGLAGLDVVEFEGGFGVGSGA